MLFCKRSVLLIDMLVSSYQNEHSDIFWPSKPWLHNTGGVDVDKTQLSIAFQSSPLNVDTIQLSIAFQSKPINRPGTVQLWMIATKSLKMLLGTTNTPNIVCRINPKGLTMK